VLLDQVFDENILVLGFSSFAPFSIIASTVWVQPAMSLAAVWMGRTVWQPVTLQLIFITRSAR
jgi:hypothetical protein